jgi:AcrR family transcriptional regulator
LTEATELSFGMARKRLAAEERRARILAAATVVFTERGYTAAKMQEIATRAGVVPSVLYDHFGSKRELHITLLESHAAQLRDRSLRRPESGSVEDLVRASITRYFEFVEDDPFLFRFLRATQAACGGVAAWWYDNRDVPRERVVELVFMLLWQGFDGMLKQAVTSP